MSGSFVRFRRDSGNRVYTYLQFHRDARSILNGLLPSRWPVLIDLHRERLCFCAECEKLRSDGICWLGHLEECGVHGNRYWACLECHARFGMGDCDCGPCGMSIAHDQALSRRVPASLAGLVGRLRIVLGARLHTYYSVALFSIPLLGPKVSRARALSGQKRHPCFLRYKHTWPAPGDAPPVGSCTAPRVFYRLRRAGSRVE
jgi:hypothetical protein